MGHRVSSRSYKGHENEIDTDNLAHAYPSLIGTRLDDCHTCHSGTIQGGELSGNACDHCHALLLHGTGHLPRETLNPFGSDYLDAGRSREALEGIKGMDSDGDGFSNEEELTAGRYPGNQSSRPGQAVATMLIVTLEELQALPSHTQFMLLNTTQQQFDDYATFRGITLDNLFGALNVDFGGATGITVIAPDGYMRSLPIELVDRHFPRPTFHSGLDQGTLGAECSLVRYPERLPDGVSDGAPLPGDYRIMLGYERDGEPLDPSHLDVATGRIAGEGPFRLVVPQEDPGLPDRGSRFSPSGCGDGLDFRAGADHNAGSMVRGVIAIRVDPMPPGVEEFDYMNGGWAYVESGQLILYGHGIG